MLLIIGNVNIFRDAALAIIDHRDWKLAMRNRTFEEGKLQTPMRKLIIKMPGIV